jgi:hypothetical protein
VVNASLEVSIGKHFGGIVCRELILAGLFQHANRSQVPQDSALANKSASTWKDKEGVYITQKLRCCRRLFGERGDGQRALAISQSVEQAEIDADTSACKLQGLCSQTLDDGKFPQKGN